MRKVFLLIGTVVLFSACGRQPIEQYKNVSDRTWEYNKPDSFEVNITQPGEYKMQIQIRYTQEYSYSNIWVALGEKGSDGKKESLRLNIPLFDLSGRAYGSFAGKFYDRNYPDQAMEDKQLTLNFPKQGKYTFILRHNMRINSLEGISQIGIRLKDIQ